MQIPAAKVYEKPEAGPHYAVLIDVVDLGIITATFNGQPKSYPALRFIWSLATVGKDGKPLQVWSKKINASSWHEKGNLYQTVKQILGVPPQPTLDPESLIGQVRQVFVSREKSPDGLKDYANIIGIVPAPAGFNLPIPADYVRVKYRPQQTAGPNGQPVQTYQAPPPQQQPQQTPPFAPQPVPGQGGTIKF
jgi:hypothetical protein